MVALLVVGAACSKSNAPPPNLTPPGLVSTPAELAFLCVTPGCNTTQAVTIAVTGTRQVAIKRAVVMGSAEFTLVVSQQAPFIINPGSTFAVSVTYTPVGAPSASAIDLAVDYTDASGTDSPDRIPPGRLLVPLVPRLVGEPVLTVNPASLSFGDVDAGSQKTMPLHLANTGYGNVALQIGSIDAGDPQLIIGTLTMSAFPPNEGTDLPIIYAPAAPSYLNTTVTITPTDPNISPVVVPVEATSLATSHIAIQPPGPVDFGQVPLHQQVTLSPNLVNQGGRPLTISGLTVTDPSGNVTAKVMSASTPAVLPPLTRVPLAVLLNAQDAGTIAAQIAITSDDPSRPVLTVPVQGTVTEPQLSLTPTSIDFGNVPVGWVLKQPLQIENVGWGLLTVKSITLVGGSSTLFTLNQMPALPLSLDRNQRIGIEVDFSAQTAATFMGTISVVTDDPLNPYATVPLTATAGPCSTSCPITNGTPDCSSGTCQIGTCNTGWYNTTGNAADGCNCQDVGAAGSTCDVADYLGSLDKTQDQSVTYNGVLPAPGDVDLLRFFATDQFDPFGPSFDTRIQLNSTDPSIQMCVYYNQNGWHDPTCYFTNEACPTNGYYEMGPHSLSSQSGDFIVKIYRQSGSAPTCTQYSVYMENGN